MENVVKIIKGLSKGGLMDIVEKYDVKQHRAVGAAYNIGKSKNGSIVFNTDGAKILGYVEIPGRPQKTRFIVFSNSDGVNVFVKKSNKITKTGETYDLTYKEIMTAREKVMKIVTNPKFKETETYKKFLLLKAIGEGDNFLKLIAVLVELGWLSFRKITIPGYEKYLEEAKEVVPLILDKEEEIKAEVAVTEEATKESSADKEIQEILSAAAKLGNAMSAAHYIRRKLMLEGHYHAQMKIALDLYYKFIKASASVKVTTGTKTSTTKKVQSSTATENSIVKTSTTKTISSTSQTSVRTIAPNSEEYAKLVDLHSQYVKIDKNRMIILEGKHLYYLNKMNNTACSLSDNIPILPGKDKVNLKCQRQAMLANGYPEEACHDGKKEWFKFRSLPNFNKIRDKIEEVYNGLLEKHTSAIIKTIKNKGRNIFRGNKARLVFIADISKPEILEQIPIYKWKVVND
ncbi:MAG: hypothetical protein MR346_09340 [Clostridium sp.]|nr:hypothetical protein [Clostridium sp.]